MAKSTRNTHVVYRDAKTGRFVKESAARRSTVVRERIPKPGMGDTKMVAGTVVVRTKSAKVRHVGHVEIKAHARTGVVTPTSADVIRKVDKKYEKAMKRLAKR